MQTTDLGSLISSALRIVEGAGTCYLAQRPQASRSVGTIASGPARETSAIDFPIVRGGDGRLPGALRPCNLAKVMIAGSVVGMLGIIGLMLAGTPVPNWVGAVITALFIMAAGWLLYERECN